MAARSYGQYCGITAAVELVAERWALLIIRDLLVGPRRYTDLNRGLPRIPTNILSARLKELQDGGVIRRVALRSCGLVYELTDYGRELEPIVLALGRWGFASLGDPKDDDIVTADSLTMALRTAFRPERATVALDFQIQLDAVALRGQVNGGALTIVQIAPPAAPIGGALPSGEPQLQFVTGPAIRHLIAGRLTAAAAVEQGVVTLLRGNVKLLERFAKLFRIDA
ncbi:MAG TPA: helix-turn-helix domain-containing protein [Solirubrobacteraceae bacterium]|nr:helix-turn-helix domain-containing protein [Solirubrobacteraceae bacterium]